MSLTSTLATRVQLRTKVLKRLVPEESWVVEEKFLSRSDGPSTDTGRL